MNTTDTIAALCTAVGGAIAIVRISGNEALKIGNQVWRGRTALSDSNERKMLLGKVHYSNNFADNVLAVYMKNPHSYTGEDVVELHCHGGNIAAKKLLTTVLNCNCRQADPGEFTFRAFINGKMDLTQAEAVCDLISAQSEMTLKMAANQLSGSLKNTFHQMNLTLTNILGECESRLDFPEENLDFADNVQVCDEIARMRLIIDKMLDESNAGQVLRSGVKVVLAGRPNAGKSSLLNLLLGADRAIVTSIAGTTRDTLEESATLRKIPVCLVDTAGLRESADEIERLGIERSKNSLKQAQVVFWVLDSSSENLTEEIEPLLQEISPARPIIAVWNKSDLCASSHTLPSLPIPSVVMSASTGTNLDALLDKFEELIWTRPEDEDLNLAVNTRQAKLLQEAQSALDNAIIEIAQENYELAAIQLRSAIADLGFISGDEIDPDILENIFSRFCIGK